MILAHPDPVLLVEDTPTLSMMYQTALTRAGLTVNAVYSAREAVQSYKARHHRVIVLDLMLPDGDGLDILKMVRETDPGVKVLVVTANGSINRAVEAMRSGAFDFLVKPFDDRRLLGAVQNALTSLEIEEDEGRVGDLRLSEGNSFHGFVGTSQRMQSIYQMIRNIGRSTATVFITGESGTGKEVAAQAIHDLSTRRSGPFVPINCGAIPGDLLESEVFGHLKGSFTGAIADKPGAAAAADGGTLFLDEICEMDLGLQTKLLRFLQTSMIQPVGATEARKVDVRIVCATNRDPMAEVRAGRFREDLFYRLHVVPIAMPPLRDRGRDVIEIAESLIRRFSQEEAKPFRGLSPRARDLFLRYPWPGNVRQLQNVLRNAIVLNDGQLIEPEMLPGELSSSMTETAPHTNGHANGHHTNGHHTNGHHAVTRTLNGKAHPINGHAGPAQAEPADAMRALVGTTLADMEREFIELTIAECGGSIPRAARILDVSPSTLYRKREAWSRSA